MCERSPCPVIQARTTEPAALRGTPTHRTVSFVITCTHGSYIFCHWTHRSPKFTRGDYLLQKRRDTTRLIYEILCLVENGASKYHVMCSANLNFPQAENYMSFLVEKGHLRLGLDHDGVRKYTLTTKGERLQYFLGQVEQELAGLFPTRPHQTINRQPRFPLPMSLDRADTLSWLSDKIRE